MGPTVGWDGRSPTSPAGHMSSSRPSLCSGPSPPESRQGAEQPVLIGEEPGQEVLIGRHHRWGALSTALFQLDQLESPPEDRGHLEMGVERGRAGQG